MDRKQLATIAVGCAVVMLIGCLALTWVSLKLPDSIEKMPEDMRAKIVDRAHEEAGKHANTTGPLILGILAGAAALLVTLGMTALVPLDSRQLLFLACALFGLAAILAFLSPWSLPEGTSENDQDSVSRGFGVWLTTLAAIGGAAACYLATTKKKGSAAPKPAAPKPEAEEKAATDDKPADDA